MFHQRARRIRDGAGSIFLLFFLHLPSLLSVVLFFPLETKIEIYFLRGGDIGKTLNLLPWKDDDDDAEDGTGGDARHMSG